MADVFGEDDIFDVFEGSSRNINPSKGRQDKKEGREDSSTSRVVEKREFKPDVAESTLEEATEPLSKKTKVDDVER